MSGNKNIPIISYTCTKCAAENTPRCKSQSLAMVCKACGTYFTFGKWSDEEVKFLEIIEPAIPIGAKGKINDFTFEVVGFVVKRDARYKVRWREYVLFNPVFGMAYLSEYNGHWNFIEPISENPKSKDAIDSFISDGREFSLFQKYKAEIVYARGEFAFDIFKVADKAINFEFIAPPYLLGLEKSDTSSLWYRGQYITQQDVTDTFKLDRSILPSSEGVGSTQPAVKVSFSDDALVKLTFLAIFFLVGFQLYLSNTSAEKQVFMQIFNKNGLPENGEKVFVTTPFLLDGGQQSLTVKVKAPVDNDWFYSDLTLVNEDTGLEYNFSKEVGYYHGYSDGESWAEGSTIGEAFLSQIPGGYYHLVIYPEFSVADSFEISVIRDVSAPSNMFITLLGLIIFPIGFFIYKHRRERARWSESDYSPYEYES
jgi:hypothetical protein